MCTVMIAAKGIHSSNTKYLLSASIVLKLICGNRSVPCPHGDYNLTWDINDENRNYNKGRAQSQISDPHKGVEAAESTG